MLLKRIGSSFTLYLALGFHCEISTFTSHWVRGNSNNTVWPKYNGTVGFWDCNHELVGRTFSWFFLPLKFLYCSKFSATYSIVSYCMFFRFSNLIYLSFSSNLLLVYSYFLRNVNCLWYVFEKEKHATLKWKPKLSQQRRSQFFKKSRLGPILSQFLFHENKNRKKEKWRLLWSKS